MIYACFPSDQASKTVTPGCQLNATWAREYGDVIWGSGNCLFEADGRTPIGDQCASLVAGDVRQVDNPYYSPPKAGNPPDDDDPTVSDDHPDSDDQTDVDDNPAPPSTLAGPEQPPPEPQYQDCLNRGVDVMALSCEVNCSWFKLCPEWCSGFCSDTDS